jgi:acetyltransferase
LQDRFSAIAAEAGIRVIGPNCFGVINVHAGLNASLGLDLPGAGGISLITQSGAYGMAAFTRSKEAGVGFAKVASPGNKSDVNEVDLLRVLGEDDETRVIAMLIESFSDGRAFFETARAITPNKPIVVLKTGRSEAAKRAAASHTAALAGDTAIAMAALKQAGIRVVRDGLALLDTASALDRQPSLYGNRIGIITNSGGTGVELADLLEEEGLTVPQLSGALQRKIDKLLPAQGSARNPVDVTTDWSRFPEMYGGALRIMLASDEVDAVMPVLLQRSALMGEVADRVIEEVDHARRQGNRKPVHICWVAPREADQNMQKLLAAGIPCEPWTDRAARTLAAAMATKPHAVPATAKANPAPNGPASDGWLASQQVFEIFENAKLPLTPWQIAKTDREALNAAEKIGFPVVLKAERAGLVHKSDAGAVHLGLRDASAVETALQDFESRLGPGPVLVQAQAEPGLELIVGGVRDPQFGPVIMFGLGGVWVEAMEDVALRLAPFGQAEAIGMFDDLKGRAVLEGLRGRQAVDLNALASLLKRISNWFAQAPWAKEFDINPLIASGKKFTIVDARIGLQDNAGKTPGSRNAASPSQNDDSSVKAARSGATSTLLM